MTYGIIAAYVRKNWQKSQTISVHTRDNLVKLDHDISQTLETLQHSHYMAA